ncbi:Retrovirus-related Pol polyprotein from transposon 17.6 [Vitis vinifera]|uniref:Retrovirus-related Pol polyprotein from transposon 17.6 n=1 Tax=Vitis vinifera TaxID=29760 RepID=A0A438CCS8_VITVI|nr:Retrovirus-related Pol polyprotein from transposon 17.6 [Vitis vinifera]
MHEVQAIFETQAHVMPCTICQSCDHVVDECPTMPAVREMLGDQANVVGQFRPNNNAPYGNTYNSSWRNHPNFSWKPRPPPYQPQAQTQAPQQTSSVEQAIVNLSKVMGDFVEIDNIQYSISRLTNLNTVNEKGKFPSQPSQNPKGVHEVEPKRGVFKVEGVSAIIQSKSPVKYKDPGCPTISVNIGGTHVEKALLDLGASVNLLPYSVYKQLGLGGLKPTAITLSLADSSHLEYDLGIKHIPPMQEASSPRREEGLEEPSCLLGGDGKRSYHCSKEDSQEATVEDPPKLVLKPLPVDLKYAYLEENEKCPVVISSTLTIDQEDNLLGVLRKCKKAIGWQISDLKGISPLVCTHHIYMEDDAKPVRQPQRRQFVGEPHPSSPKKSGITVVQNEKGEEVSTRPTSGWRDILSTVFWMVLGENALWLCNAPATFQRCMLSIFSDMVERIMEVFMDDITVYGSSYEECLLHLEAVLQRCIEKDLVLNWEKCHFMVQQGIVLGHIISKNGIEVDKAKVELIVKLPPPTNVKGIRQFLGHAGFYRRFIKDFSKISKPLCELLVKDAKFVWDEKCQKSFEELKQFLTTAPIVRAPNWKLPFEVMCDASDLAMGAVLGQREDGKPYWCSLTIPLEVLANQARCQGKIDKMDPFAPRINLQIRDKKGVENVVADHLSRLVISHDSHGLPINDDFPEESLMSIEVAPWYSHIANFLVTGEVPSEWSAQDKRHFFAKIHAYYWEEPFLFKYCADQIIRKCVPEQEQ